VIAKFVGIHGGLNKYLLESPEQKAKFLAAWLNYDFILQHTYISMQGNFRFDRALTHEVGALTEKVSSGTVFEEKQEDIPYLDGGILFQEVIENPGNRYTTFRVLADASGQVQYVALIISPHKKNERILKRDRRRKPMSVATLNEEVLGTHIKLLDNLYTQPQSPFYLGAKSITSYHDEKSEEYILEGQQFDDPELRQLIADHGMDPDHATPSPHLVDIGSRLGRAFRGYSPYGGFDLMLDKKGNFIYIEGNEAPGIAPAAFDLPEDASDEMLQTAVIEKMLQNMDRLASNNK